MDIYRKIQDARDHIKKNKLEKAGYNSYGKYHYYTPEQINQLVYEAEKECGLFHTFELLKDEYGYYGFLVVRYLDNDLEHNRVELVQRTEIPSITATNAAQQVGGAVTYTNRYMLMTLYDIADNSLDFDSKDNRKKPAEKKATNTVKPAEKKKVPTDKEITEVINTINMCTELDELRALWEQDSMKPYRYIQEAIDAKNKRKGILLNG